MAGQKGSSLVKVTHVTTDLAKFRANSIFSSTPNHSLLRHSSLLPISTFITGIGLICINPSIDFNENLIHIISNVVLCQPWQGFINHPSFQIIEDLLNSICFFRDQTTFVISCYFRWNIPLTITTLIPCSSHKMPRFIHINTLDILQDLVHSLPNIQTRKFSWNFFFTTYVQTHYFYGYIQIK